jgi:hypothetical protein
MENQFENMGYLIANYPKELRLSDVQLFFLLENLHFYLDVLQYNEEEYSFSCKDKIQKFSIKRQKRYSTSCIIKDVYKLIKTI